MSAAADVRARAGVPRARPKPPLVIPWRRLGLALVAVAVGALCAWAYDRVCAYEQRAVTLDGVALARDRDPGRLARDLATSWLDTEVSIDTGSQIVRATRRELGAHVDVGEIVGRARLARGYAPLPSRVWAWISGSQSSLSIERRVDADELRVFVEELRRRTSVEPEAIRRDGTGGRPGVSPQLAPSVAVLGQALDADALFVSLPLLRFEPMARPNQDGAYEIFREVVASYETRYAYSGDAANRAVNVELAASLLDGAIVAPERELSFNQLVGERSFDRGFLPATELDGGGRRVDGIGGGICQVAATLHAATFLAAFEILEHHPHTRNSSYIPPGLDAAVSWPGHDVRVRNTLPYSVRVRASARRGRLRIDLMGARRAPRVEWSTTVLSRTPRGLERELDRNLPVGTEDVLDEGEDGSVVERTRTIHWNDGPVTERVELRYPTVSRLVRVGPSGVR